MTTRAQTGRLVPVGPYAIHVREDGRKDAPPLVLLHGFLGSMHWFDRLVPLLSGHFRLIRTDLLGHGRSSKPGAGYRPEDQAYALDVLLDRMGVTDATILGHSMGADVAIALAEQGFKVNRLVVIDEPPDYLITSPPGINSLMRRRWAGQVLYLYRSLPASATQAAVAAFFAPGYPAPSAFDVPDRAVRDARAVPSACFLQSQFGQRRFFEEAANDARLRALGIPALVIFGEQDQLFRSAESCDRYRLVRNVRVETIPGAGHSPMLENPSRTAEIIRAFLTRASAPTNGTIANSPLSHPIPMKGAAMTSRRAVTVIDDLERTLVEFIRKHRITHEEYRQATDLIIAEIKAGEESLLFDVFLEAEATDIGAIGRAGSIEAIEGPFYLPGAPELSPPYQMPQRADEAGDTLVFAGRVTSVGGAPLAGVELDMWQADASGLYSNIHPGIPDWNLRGRFHSETDGTFQVTTIVPPPYEIPKDGPTGIVLNALGRHFYRPAHLHVKLRHPGYGQMTSQLYFEGGKYLDSDVAHAVRDGLVLPLTRRDDPAEIARLGLSGPFLEARYEFALPTERGNPSGRTSNSR